MNVQYALLAGDIHQCKACNFHRDDFEPLAPAFASVPVALMFIGENPSWADGQSTPFSEHTNSGNALTLYYLEPLGLKRNQVWITDLFKCRYPLEPVDIYHSKRTHEHMIQRVAETCARLFLMRELALAQPKVVVTLSDREVYQRVRRMFGLTTPAQFAEVVGKPHSVAFGETSALLFPMVHPDIGRPPGVGDRKDGARKKWSAMHEMDHIPALRRVLECQKAI